MEDNTDVRKDVANKNGASGINERGIYVEPEEDYVKIENKQVKFDIKEDTDKEEMISEKDGADRKETAEKKKLRVVGMRNGEYKIEFNLVKTDWSSNCIGDSIIQTKIESKYFFNCF